MKTTNRKLWRLVTAMTFALVLASPIARKAEADQNRLYMLPMADARAFGEVVEHDFDALILDELGDLIPRQAYAFEKNIGTSTAFAEASENQFVVKASSGGYGSADARAFMEFVVRDPEARG